MAVFPRFATVVIKPVTKDNRAITHARTQASKHGWLHATLNEPSKKHVALHLWWAPQNLDSSIFELYRRKVAMRSWSRFQDFLLHDRKFSMIPRFPASIIDRLLSLFTNGRLSQPYSDRATPTAPSPPSVGLRTWLLGHRVSCQLQSLLQSCGITGHTCMLTILTRCPLQ